MLEFSFKVNFGGITKDLKSLIKKLLTKSPEERRKNAGENLEKIKNNSFYGSIWEKLEKREVKAPFQPNLKGITGEFVLFQKSKFKYTKKYIIYHI